MITHRFFKMQIKGLKAILKSVFIYGLCFCILFLISLIIQTFKRFFLLNVKVLHLTSGTLTYLELLSCERWRFSLAFFLLCKPSVLEPNSKWFFPPTTTTPPPHWCVMAPLSYTRFITHTHAYACACTHTHTHTHTRACFWVVYSISLFLYTCNNITLLLLMLIWFYNNC